MFFFIPLCHPPRPIAGRSNLFINMSKIVSAFLLIGTAKIATKNNPPKPPEAIPRDSELFREIPKLSEHLLPTSTRSTGFELQKLLHIRL